MTSAAFVDRGIKKWVDDTIVQLVSPPNTYMRTHSLLPNKHEHHALTSLIKKLELMILTVRIYSNVSHKTALK